MMCDKCYKQKDTCHIKEVSYEYFEFYCKECFNKTKELDNE